MYESKVQNLESAPMMDDVSVNEARRNFKEILDRVCAGEEISIARHGRPIARIVPVNPRRQRLPDMTEFLKTITYTGKPLSQIVIEEREKDR